MELFEEIQLLDVEKEKFEKEFVKKIKKYKYVYLWGISESCDEAIYYLNKNNIKINGIYNANADKYNYTYRNIPVLPQSFDNIDTGGAVIVTNSYYDLFRKKLIDRYLNIDDFLYVFDGYFLEEKTVSYYLDNKETIIKCYNALADKHSKKLYNALLKYRYVRDPKIIKELYDLRDNCYLDNIFINNFKDGLYIDAGSYNADFITSLKDKVNISKSKFYIFEPNKDYCNKIEKYLDKTINYKIFNMALCDKQDKLPFIKLNSSTSHLKDEKYNAYKIVDGTTDYVDTSTLDIVLKDEKVVGIKIDIEGSEASMLVGATNIIKRDKPIILLSIYHRWDDLFKLQGFLMNLTLNYKFYIRHYSLSVAKTVLYCIPD